MEKEYRTNVQRKLAKFFKDTGVKKEWFAKKVGFQRHFIYVLNSGLAVVQPSSWKAFLEHTAGYVTMEDLLSDFIQHRVRSLYFYEIKEFGQSWVISVNKDRIEYFNSQDKFDYSLEDKRMMKEQDQNPADV